MAVKRDYGSFARATETSLPPLVGPLGYEHLGHGLFGRRREKWIEGFNLQQSHGGDGDFSVNLGIHVPGLSRWWQNAEQDETGGFVIWSRLSERGADRGDMWLPAATKLELTESLAKVAALLPEVNSWFSRFGSLAHIAEGFLKRSNLIEVGKNDRKQQLSAANYGFLLAESGQKAEAVKWLREAERLMALPVFYAKDGALLHEKQPGARLSKPSAEDIRQLEIVRSALRKLSR